MESDQQEELNEEEKEELLLQKQRKLLSDVLQQQGSQFVIKSYISAGSFGSVFLLEKQGEQYIAKVGRGGAESALLFETFILKKLTLMDNPYIPKLIHFKVTQEYNLLISQYKGISLQKYLENVGRIPEYIGWNIVIQFLKAIKLFHQAGFVHRDLKPQNLLINRSEQSKHDFDFSLYLIDFGLASRYKQFNDVLYNNYTKQNFVGTPRTASISSSLGVFQYPKDDIESFCYVISYLLNNRLPWQNLAVDSKSNRYRVICELKIQYTSSRENIQKNLFNTFNPVFVELLLFTKQPQAFLKPSHYDIFINKFQSLFDSYTNIQEPFINKYSVPIDYQPELFEYEYDFDTSIL